MSQRTVLIKRLTPLAMQWGVTVYSAAVSLGLSVLFARSMGSSEFGHYTYIYVLASFLMLVQDAGFNTLLLRERAAPSEGLRSRYTQLPGIALLHLGATTSFFIFATAFLYQWLDGPSLIAGIFCFATITLTQWQSSWFKGAGHFKLDAIFLFCGRSLSALFVLGTVLVGGATPVNIFYAWGLGLLLALALHYKFLPFLGKTERKLPIWAYRSSFTFFAICVASALYHQIDIVILRNILGEVPGIGHYAVATRVYDGLRSLAVPVVLMLFRRMRVLALNPGVDNGFSRNAVLGALLVGSVLALVGWLLGPWMVGSLFGRSYAEGTQTIIRLMFIALIFALLNAVLEQSAVATQHERLFAVSLFLAVGINVVLNFYLIPIMGVQGAAWATIATEASITVALTLGLRRQLF